MLCRKFELIPIKFGIFTNFLSCSKIRQKLNFTKGDNFPFSIIIIIIIIINYYRGQEVDPTSLS